MSHCGVDGLAMLCKPSSHRTAGARPGQGGERERGHARQPFLGGFQYRGRAGKGFQAAHGKLCGQPPCLQASSYLWPYKAL